MLVTLKSNNMLHYIYYRLWYIIDLRTYPSSMLGLLKIISNGIVVEMERKDREYDVSSIVSIRIGLNDNNELSFVFLIQQENKIRSFTKTITNSKGETRIGHDEDGKMLLDPPSSISNLIEQFASDYRQEKVYEISKKSADLSEKSIEVSEESLKVSTASLLLGLVLGIFGTLLALNQSGIIG